MPEAPLPTADKAGTNAKAVPAHAAVLGDAKVTIEAPAFRVFAALTEPDQLAAWFGEDAYVEPDEGGRYESTLSIGRVEGTIIAIDGPETLAFTFDVDAQEAPVTTSVHYALAPRGPQTAVHLSHRAPKEVPGDWTALWTGVLQALKAYVEENASGSG